METKGSLDVMRRVQDLIGREMSDGSDCISRLCMDSLSYIVSRSVGDKLNMLKTQIHSLGVLDRVIMVIEKGERMMTE